MTQNKQLKFTKLLEGKMKMALVVLLLMFGFSRAASTGGEMALTNVTRFNLAGGDLFSMPGTDCGLTRCMEVSQGTALSTMGAGGDCVCQCHSDTPAFREDRRVCVNHIDECQMASFGRGTTKPQIPFVFLPLKGQIIYPAKEIIFSDVDDAICVVTSAQYLTATGWVTLRDVIDNDVPFGLYRDEGKTFLQWRGSSVLHSRLEGRLVAAHVLCSSQSPARLVSSCAAFRVAGTSRNTLLDVRSIPFHAGEIVSSELSSHNQGLSVLESLAIGVCVLMLIFVYAAGIVFYIHYKQRQKKKEKDPEMNRSNTMSTDNGSNMDSTIDMDNMCMKTNPLMGLDSLGNDFLNDNGGLSDVSERTEDTLDSSPNNPQKKVNTNVTAAMVHTRRKKPVRPSIRTGTQMITERLQRRSASPDTLERAPHSDLSIIDCSVDTNSAINHSQPTTNSEPAIRRKLYFNPVFFETEHLKNPPPAAIDFLVKIREVMSVAKEKMTSKRFIPILTDIPEEDLYHTIDLGWNIPCARRGRRFSAISLKRENSRRAVHCGGCPGCDNSVREQKVTLARSNSCKTCVSDDYRQKIVRKWLDEVPSPPQTSRPVRSVAKVSGTPRVVEPKKNEDHMAMVGQERNEPNRYTDSAESVSSESIYGPTLLTEDLKKLEIRIVSDENIDQKPVQINLNNKPKNDIIPKNSCNATRRVRKKLPPPPPPPISLPEPPEIEEAVFIPPEVKKKMEAVIKELNKCRRTETFEGINSEPAPHISPKIIIPVVAADSQYYSDDNLLADNRKRDIYRQKEQMIDLDSLDRSMLKKRRFSVACGPDLARNYEIERQLTMASSKDKSRSWRDVRKAVDDYELTSSTGSDFENRSLPVSEIFINNTIEPLYNNIPKLGSLTIQVRGSPVESRKNVDQFDPDTLDRKPKVDERKKVDKILLKSGGSFKYKSLVSDSMENKSPPETAFNRKIGSLRQIYEAKAKAQEEEIRYSRGIYERRSSVVMTYDSDELASFIKSAKTPDLLRQTEQLKPPAPPKQERRASDACYTNISRDSNLGDRRRSPEERERFPNYNRNENLNARRSGRRSARTRSRRTDLRKLYKTEDSGYLSTDSNESKRRARYLMQLKPRTIVPEPIKIVQQSLTIIPKTHPPVIQIESDTDELESLCDGRSESGGESIETDSVFFGHFDESKQMFAELGLSAYEAQTKIVQNQDQIDSGFLGETNIILSGDSDSEHRSVISIVAGCDGRASAASIAKLDESPFKHSVEC